MNNLTLGNERFTYYETMGGGQGACPDADGPSAVHVAMSNTLNTPIEALEVEFPLRVREYALGAGRAAPGRHSRRRRGRARGRGARADDVLAAHRAAPRGPARAPPAAAPGLPGRNLLMRDGREPEALPSKAEGVLQAGERLRLETPGRRRLTGRRTADRASIPGSHSASGQGLTDSPINTWNFRDQRLQWAAGSGFFACGGLGRRRFQGDQAHRARNPVRPDPHRTKSMPVAFKEWAVTVRALAEGEQLLTLRKGGIREENKHFELDHERFFLYPDLRSPT